MSKSSHIPKYLTIGGTLLFLTGVTVGVSFLHLGIFAAVIVALLVSMTKGSLVAAYFMHLIGEHRWIYFILILTVILFFVMLLVPVLVNITDYKV